MSPFATIIILAVAGVLQVVQNLLMVRITASASTVIVTLVLNSGAGLVLLLSTLSARDGLGAPAAARDGPRWVDSPPPSEQRPVVQDARPGRSTTGLC